MAKEKLNALQSTSTDLGSKIVDADNCGIGPTSIIIVVLIGLLLAFKEAVINEVAHEKS